ncbi:recombinase family protein [Cytobacillus oceanisediminis]|jgi:site-specific DNA recombinase|uniref:recombinase family protein n=1 Tax=Bacillaceae TaxID=186817 RepID=UPI001CCE56C1|nr:MULTISPECIES: recombinase family protein [Bacillaceae]MBZ9534909.1 recombinase family protein [Cytobacillus oceanisediminis]UTI44397.1 recombinase family protein [Niallia sp. RD1]
MKCVAYIRVSTDEQAKHGYSIAAQEEKLKAFCISQGWELVGDPYIDDGYSAKDLNRPKFQMMMDQIKQGGIDVLLVYRLDRLTRSVLDLYEILKVLDAHDCKFKSATEIYDTTNAMGRLFITLVAAIAQWERENTAERVQLGMEKKTKLGIWKGGTPPYGYKIIDKKLIIDKDEEPIIKYIFQLSKSLGFFTIAKKLTEQGFSTRKGGDWHVDTVRDIANNPVYAGYLTFNKNKKDSKKPPREQTLYEGIHDRIISRNDFWELQDILDKRRTFGGKRETSDYYFSSILKCARCGSSMSGHRGGSSVKTYRCSGKKAGKNCTSHIIMEDNLVLTILNSLEEITKGFTGDTQQNNISAAKIASLENELKLTQKLLKKQKVMYQNDIIGIEELIEETETLREKEKQLTAELLKFKNAARTNTEEIKFILENIQSLWEDANDYERKQLIGTIFSQIVVDTEDEYKRGIPRKILIVSAK